MRFRIMKKVKTLMLTFGVVSLGMYVLLNTLATEISLKDVKVSEMMSDKIQLVKSLNTQKPLQQDTFQNRFVAHGQRKQKTLLNNEYHHIDDNYVYEQDDVEDKHEQAEENIDVKDVNKITDHRNQFNDKTRLKEDMVKKLNEFDDSDEDFEDEQYNPDEFNEENVYDDNDDDDDKDDDDDDNDDNYHYDDATEAQVQQGGFDNGVNAYFRKPKLKLVRMKNLEKVDNSMLVKKEIIEDKIYWSQYVESLIPRGKSYPEVTKDISELRKQVVKTLDKPSWDKCGRPMNGYAVLNDETRLCVRYRQPHTSFIYGEALSFYLSRLLQMDNVPTVLLAKTNSTSKLWRAVNISSLTWEEDKMVALIEWVHDINSGFRSKTYIPPLLLQSYRSGEPVTERIIQESSHKLNANTRYITDIVQWGTMIIFDYLTGNYDRVASMQDAENRENNPKIMEESIRNLKKSASNGKLWLIDNECGLLDAYQLLEPYSPNTRFTTFHKQMLQTMCVFERPFVTALRKLNSQPSPHKRLEKFAVSFEPMLADLPNEKLYDKFSHLFDKRLAEVISWIQHCESL
ncbi:hypothetical protein ACF0H5_015201 [Mactra antiquata]